MAKIRTTIEYGDTTIPVEVHLEKRRTLRAAFGRDKVIVRIPSAMSQEAQRSEYEKAKKWIAKTISKSPILLNQFLTKEYNGSSIVVMNKEYTILVSHNGLNSCKVRLEGNTIKLAVPEQWDDRVQHDTIKKSLSKIFAKAYSNRITEEVRTLNQRYFQEEIQGVKLKYNKSNWGSCSSKKNINLSTRLLLVPDDVRQYVIIHELAHLREMNHSSRFWALVKDACPNYDEHENWLTEHGPRIDF